MDLLAPSHWRTLEFISDVHLFEQDRQTFEAWRAYLAQCSADALFILGDLFEVWIGDDALEAASPFEHACVEALRQCAQVRTVFFMPGNRDFLVGDALLGHLGIQRLPDPTILVFQGERIALSHGDFLCTGDEPYQRFRTEVRSPQWQRQFLSKPLPERHAIARGIREASEGRKSSVGYTDVQPDAVLALLQHHRARVLVHGHTHEGRTHTLEEGKQRIVLSDWCADAALPRLEVMQLRTDNAGSSVFTRKALPRPTRA